MGDIVILLLLTVSLARSENVPEILPPLFSAIGMDMTNPSNEFDYGESVYNNNKDDYIKDILQSYSFYGRNETPPPLEHAPMRNLKFKKSSKKNGYGKIDISIQYGCCPDDATTAISKQPEVEDYEMPPSEYDYPLNSAAPDYSDDRDSEEQLTHVGTIELRPEIENTTSNSRFEDLANVPFYLSPKRDTDNARFYNEPNPSSIATPQFIETTRSYEPLEEPPRYVFSPRPDPSIVRKRYTDENENFKQKSQTVNENINLPTQTTSATIADQMNAYSIFGPTSTIAPVEFLNKINRNQDQRFYQQTYRSQTNINEESPKTASTPKQEPFLMYSGLIPPSVSLRPQSVSIAPIERGHIFHTTFRPPTSASQTPTFLSSLPAVQFFGTHVTPRNNFRNIPNKNLPRSSIYEQQDTARMQSSDSSISNRMNSNFNSGIKTRLQQRLSPVQREQQHRYFINQFYQRSPDLQVKIHNQPQNLQNNPMDSQSAISTPNYPDQMDIVSNENIPDKPDQQMQPNPLNEPNQLSEDMSGSNPTSSNDLIKRNRATFTQMQQRVYFLFTDAALKDFQKHFKGTIEKKKIDLLPQEQKMLGNEIDLQNMRSDVINMNILDYLTIYERYSDVLNDTDLDHHILQDIERAKDYLTMKLNKFWVELDEMNTAEEFLEKKNYYRSREKPSGIMNVFYNWYEDLICKPNEVNEDKIKTDLLDIMKKEKRYWLLLLKT